MPHKHYENRSDEEIENVIRDIVEKRCQVCGIKPEDILGNIFNIQWIKNWVRTGMPLDRRDQDFKYETLMANCRIEIDERLS